MTVEINFIYPSQIGTEKIYENEKGIIHRSNTRNQGQINIALGYFANRNPSDNDSLLCLEPICVAPLDYSEKINKYNKIFSWCQPGMKLAQPEKLHIINHPTWADPPKYESLIRPDWSERYGFVVVSNNKTSDHYSQIYDVRISIADYLHSKNYDVSWWGQEKLDRPYYKGPIKDKLEVLRRARFCICPENCYDEIYSHGYFSEKMPDALFGGAVPIYMGCYNIDELVPKECYIDLRKFVTKTPQNKMFFQEFDDVINSFTNTDYLKMIDATNEFMNSENGLYHVISSDRAHDKIIDSFL